MSSFPTSRAPLTVETHLGPVEVSSTGEGPAVLALHGGMGGWDQSELLARATLPDRFRVLSVSRPGYLGTPLASGSTPQDQADLYPALLDALGLHDVMVVAVSAGGPSALQFAERHPERCRGLILVSACTERLTPPEQVRGRLPLIRLFAAIPFLERIMRWRLAKNPERAAARSIADPELRRKTLAHRQAGPLIKALQDSALHRIAERLPGTLNDMAQFEKLDGAPLARITARVLAIHGTADRIVPFNHARSLGRRIAHVDIHAVVGGDHVALFTHYEAVRARIQTFMAAGTA